MSHSSRREFFQALACGAAGVTLTWPASGQQSAPPIKATKLSDHLAVVMGDGGNVGVVIGPDGLAHNIQVAKGLGLGLDQKAADAVQQWLFSPGMKDGSPVPVAATIEVNFRLL